jgi:hypothetical protein
MQTRVFTLALVATLTALAGCGGDTKKTPGTDAKPADAKPADAKPADAPKPEAEKLTLVDVDLTPAGASWAGWTAKGPADASVMEDLGGARIATKKVRGPGSFDIAFKQGKIDLKERKDQIMKGAEMAKSTVTFTVDTPEALEWTSAFDTSKSFEFVQLRKVGDVEVACYTVSPRPNAEEIATLKESCASLAKK